MKGPQLFLLTEVTDGACVPSHSPLQLFSGSDTHAHIRAPQRWQTSRRSFTRTRLLEASLPSPRAVKPSISHRPVSSDSPHDGAEVDSADAKLMCQPRTREVRRPASWNECVHGHRNGSVGGLAGKQPPPTLSSQTDRQGGTYNIYM